ncbi:hypothetical protein [Hominibacterium faecale]|uniref:hypothetical protein n=1 Tax=Hominibacterium faecale TaxID=2839743 RepID=UPI0022B297DA|nr:hypothetical protein [Hominibacterium faecale]
MKKKLIAAVVSLTMAVTMFPSLAFAGTASKDAPAPAGVEQTDEAQLTKAKEDAKDDLKYYWGNSGEKHSDFDDEGRAAIDQIRSEGNAAIDEAVTTDAVDEALNAAKGKIDQVKTKEDKFDEAKEAATDALTGYWGTNGEEAAKEADYDTTVKGEVETLRTNALDAISNATFAGGSTAADIIKLQEEAIAAIDAKDTIAEHKAAVKEEIDSYFPEKAANGLDDYDQDEQTAVTEAKEAAKTEVDGKAVNAEMDGVYTTLQSTIDAIKTTAEKSLASEQEKAAKELDAYFPEGVASIDDYASDQQTAVTDAKNDGKTAINNADSMEAVAAALAEAKEAIDKIPTSKALDDQTKALIEKINAIGDVRIGDYNEKYDALLEAEELYSQLNAAGVEDDAITNLKVLTDARTAYDGFKASEVVGLIKDLGTIDADNYVTKKAQLETTEAEFNKISSAASSSVTNANNLTTARSDYDTAAKAVTDFETKVTEELGELEPVAYTNKTVVEEVKTAYEALSEMQQGQVSAEIMALYNGAVTVITDFDTAIDHVKELIKNLPAPITGSVADKQALSEARSAYNNLLDEDAQADVDTFGDLQTAEAAYVDALIDAIGDTDAITNEVLANTEAARTAYDELKELDTDAADKVSNGDTLEAAEAAIKDYQEAIGQAAFNEAEAAFKAVQAVEEVTDENAEAVETAIEAYNQLHIADAETAEKTFKERYDELGALMQAYADQKAAAEKEKADTQKLMYASVTVADQIYTGSAIEPAVSVKDKAGNAVTADNYDLFFKDNGSVGTASVTVVAKNNSAYTGSKTVNFKIVARSISGASVSGISDKTYTGKAITQPVNVTAAGRTLAAGTEYTVAYSGNKAIGKATVTITARGNYSGSISKTFTIKPAKGAIKSLKAGKKKMTVKVKAQSGAKYQIAYKVKGAKKYKTVKVSGTSKTIKKLKKGKTYTVKVRAYKAIDGKTYYGAYSKTKKVRVK